MMKKNTKSLKNALRLLEQQEKELKDMQRILNEFAQSMVTVKANKVLTEKEFTFIVKNYIDISFKSSYAQQQYSSRHDSLNKRTSVRKEISVSISSKMAEYVENVLKKLNQYTDLQFHLISYKHLFVYDLNDDGTLQTDNFNCTIDIY